ncbi:superoxide dismutase [Cu-Zn], chloroplastic-like [Paramuricea clavata]|uniref:Superoxide dismutase [Cu-Zn] n=1 Tax=Paramuricea clavata TaxID=317549 RepID=A0A6S7IFU8_PARCT|nr:superoxide dismutase [Cu-Zn], chloroplastic-like [Paramuricea clavata]
MARFVQVLLATLVMVFSSATATPYSYYASQDAVVTRAKSILRPGNNAAQTQVKGTVEVVTIGRATYIRVHITGLPSNSVHGFHIHQYGDIITTGCSSTGGHYNPYRQTHGAQYDNIRHVGDLGNVYADKDGTVKVVKRDYLISLVGKYNVLGRAFVLHALKDDLGRGGNVGSRTTGNAGGRIACGVIVRVPAETKS